MDNENKTDFINKNKNKIIPFSEPGEKDSFKYNIYLDKDNEIKLNTIASFYKDVNLTKKNRQDTLIEIALKALDEEFSKIVEKLKE